MTVVLLVALLTGAVAGRTWLIDHLPAEARVMLLLLLWLLPLATMAIAAASTARRLRRSPTAYIDLKEELCNN